MERLWEKNYDFWYHCIHFQRMTVQDMLHVSAAVAPDKVATDFFGTQIAYYQLRLLSTLPEAMKPIRDNAHVHFYRNLLLS